MIIINININITINNVDNSAYNCIDIYLFKKL